MVQLLLSELMTNALVHGHGGEVEDEGVRIAVEAVVIPATGRIRVAVHDPGHAVPNSRARGDLATNGRGLHLVEAFAADHGWTPAEAGTGKWVWFECDLDPSATAVSSFIVAEELPDRLNEEQRRQRTAMRLAILNTHNRIRRVRPQPTIGVIGPGRPRRVTTQHPAAGRVA
ncbi:hypothetical protein GCM10010505_76590 [Kitasatospora aburaviensis]